MSTLKYILTAAAVLVMGVSGAQASEKTKTEAKAKTEKAAEAAAPQGDEGVIKLGDPVVASVDGEEIKRSEVLNFINTLPMQLRQMPIQQLFPLAVEQVVNNRVVSKKAEAAKLEADPDVTKLVDDAKKQIVRNVYLERQVEAEMNPKRVLKAYEKALEGIGEIQEVKARHILVDTEEKAKELIAKLNKGEDFAKLATDNTKDTGTAPGGGDLGYFAKNEMVAPFAEAAFAMKAGEVSKTPVKTEFGWHVIKVEDKRKRPDPAFETVKPQLEQQVRQEILKDLVTKWQKDAKVKTFDINGDPVKETKAN